MELTYDCQVYWLSWEDYKAEMDWRRELENKWWVETYPWLVDFCSNINNTDGRKEI